MIKSASINLTSNLCESKALFVHKRLILHSNLRIYAQITMTNFIKKNEIKNNWVLINAENAIVGRLASYISIVLRGKNKNQYTPHMDNGDFVVVTNIEKIKFSGKKLDNKKYFRHTGYPGGIKSTVPSTLLKNKPEEILKLAVKRMLPGGPLAKKQLTKLKIYKGTAHPHESQNPKILDFAKMNSKNYMSAN
jgi:large subunit ribosomal protein L13